MLSLSAFRRIPCCRMSGSHSANIASSFEIGQYLGEFLFSSFALQLFHHHSTRRAKPILSIDANEFSTFDTPFFVRCVRLSLVCRGAVYNDE